MPKILRYTLASLALFLLWQAGAVLLGPSVLPTPGAASMRRSPAHLTPCGDGDG